ncbi:MAG: alpha/beta hydrolase [Microbacteriaceae bacterium]|nr:alpha/beta hydrolase [Microbacteriaceae bacterium]
MAPIRTTYGGEPSQFFERQSGGDRGTLVLIHGGWWRDIHDLSLMSGLTARFAEAGWDVVNLEYRRTGGDGGGWPQTFEDVTAALDLTLSGGTRPVVLMGHSAGGHLALLAARYRSDVTGVVALAPVTDLVRSKAEGLGEEATALFLAGSSSANGEPSPHRLLPLGIPLLTVHGAADQRVPIEHSRDFVAAALEAGDQVELLVPPDADHFAMVDPQQKWWIAVESWLDEKAPREN